MTKDFENKGNNYIVNEHHDIGEVCVADEVIAIIAGLAATDVPGVVALAGNITNEIVSKSGMKSLSKGVRVTVGENSVNVDIAINLKFGAAIPKVCADVQDKVKSSIEVMTGLEVAVVNVKVCSVALDK